MSWLAILLTLASMGSSPAQSQTKTGKRCSATVKTHCKAKPKPRAKPKPKKPAPRATPTPAPTKPTTPGAQRDDSPGSPGAPTPTPTATPKPGATPTPTPKPAATPTPTATATPAPPVYPSRTGVELLEWRVRPAYRTLAAGRIDFNVLNQGEDDHNLSVRGGGKEYGRLDLAPGEEGALVLQLSAGTYTLYCSLTGHEEEGMKTDISVR